MKERVCGNCRCFKNEDVYGFGWCDKLNEEVHCGLHYDCHEDLNGWTLITKDNEEEVYNIPSERLVFANYINGTPFYTSFDYMTLTISTMAQFGGYYYYVLPELKIE